MLYMRYIAAHSTKQQSKHLMPSHLHPAKHRPQVQHKCPFLGQCARSPTTPHSLLKRDHGMLAQFGGCGNSLQRAISLTQCSFRLFSVLLQGALAPVFASISLFGLYIIIKYFPDVSWFTDVSLQHCYNLASMHASLNRIHSSTAYIFMERMIVTLSYVCV